MDGIDVSWGSHSPKDARACRHTGDGSFHISMCRYRFSTEQMSKPGTKSSLMERNSGDMLADGIESESGTKI
ncbi:MAG TPA: hypothetical protein PKW51_08285, partial [Methanoregulaceae archaeon]|nr:hypothetical protein [Methanoregulaceae archaeon]